MGHVSGFVEFCGSELWVRTNSELLVIVYSTFHFNIQVHYYFALYTKSMYVQGTVSLVD